MVQGEWFLDTDPGKGKATAFSFASTGEVSKSLDIDLANLSEGFHQLFIRVKAENGRWSHHEGRMFYVIEPSKYTMSEDQPMLSAAEYFMDKDPGVGKGKPISLLPADSISMLADLDVSNLTEGPHTLSVRVRNSKGVWSLYEQRSFFIIESTPVLPIANTQLKAYEWYVDKDPGFGKGNKLAIALTDTLVTAVDLSMLNLTDGAHLLYIRVQNTLNQWSLVETRKFTICSNLLSLPEISSKPTICSGDTLYLTGKSVVGASGYLWKGPNNFTGTGLKVNIPNASEIQSGVYTLFASRAGGTGCDTSSASISVSVNPLPNVSFTFDLSVCDTVKSVPLTGGNPVGGTYTGEFVSNNTFSSLNKAGRFDLFYTYSDKNGCFSKASSSIEVINCDQASLYDISVSTINVYPNPTTDFVTIGSKDNTITQYLVKVCDVLGRNLFTEKTEGFNTSISLRKLGGSGVYLVYLYDSNGVFIHCQQVILSDNILD